MGFDAHHGLGVFAVDAEGDGHAAAAVQGVREIEFILKTAVSLPRVA